jgi:hypothetical protein
MQIGDVAGDQLTPDVQLAWISTDRSVEIQASLLSGAKFERDRSTLER